MLGFFSVKFNFGRKKSIATTFLSVKTSRGIVVATSFLYIMVHRWIAGDVPIYQKDVLKVTNPFRKRRVRQISINSAQPWEIAIKVELSLIESRQCAFHRAIDELCALPLSPQRVAQNENFYPRGTSEPRVIAIIVCPSVCHTPV